MTNYLLSIDPSIKNTGFTLWEKRCHVIDCENNNCIKLKLWMPIWIKSYSFEKFKNINPTFDEQIIFELFMIGEIKHFDNMNIIIERGTFHSKNGIGYETQEHLRGFIAGQFNKLITKNMLISPSSWKKWYKNRPFGAYWDIKNEKWTKETSLAMAQIIISENEWNFNITNHDEADSLLIGWYYLNKENK
ncbi:hypothetical protein [Spiroplasma endosymbiont of Amphimallon solstitiale]|uniref:hypothetical protein n=1 Tax=Spiroplasma endosymbiont of Amphimallon solstitiale TaxID=3066288 RepID=UPI00313D550A